MAWHWLFAQLLVAWALGASSLAQGATWGCYQAPTASSVQECFDVSQCGHRGAPLSQAEPGIIRQEPGDSLVASPGAVLDLYYKKAAVAVTGSNVVIRDMELRQALLSKPMSSPFGLQGFTVSSATVLQLRNVTINTDCFTWSHYYSWKKGVSIDASAAAVMGAAVIFDSWAAPGIEVHNVSVVCDPPRVKDALGSAFSLADGRDLHSSLAYIATLGSTGTDFFLNLAANISLESCVWVHSPATLARNVTLRPAANTPGNHGMFDLWGRNAAIQLANSARLVIENISLVNLAPAGGYAPLPLTGHGLVASWLWAFNFTRSLTNVSTDYLTLRHCHILVNKAEFDHMSVWVALLTITGPYAVYAAPYKVGIQTLQVVDTKSDTLLFSAFQAYGLHWTDVHLEPAPAGVVLVGPSNTVPLYSLELPVQVSVIPVFTTEDFVSALTQLASLLDPPPPGPLCAVVQMYTNITLDDFDVPAGGFEVPCQVLVQGLPDGVNYYGTSLDLALQAPLFRLTGLGAMVFRWMTFVNAPSENGQYSLAPASSSLSTLTLPLWSVGRDMSTNASLVTLKQCTVVLPDDEYQAFVPAVGLASSTPASAVMQQSISSYEDATMKHDNLITIGSLTGFGWRAEQLNITNVSNAFTLALQAGAFEGSSYPPPPPPSFSATGPVITAAPTQSPAAPVPKTAASPNSSDPHHNEGKEHAVLGAAIGVPLGVVILLAAASVFVLLYRQRRAASPDPASPKPKGDVETADCDGKVHGNTLCARESSEPLGVSSGTSRQGENSDALPVPGGARDSSVGCDSPSVAASTRGDEGGGRAPRPFQELHSLIHGLAQEINDKHLVIHGVLGSGGFAKVYRGTWRGLDVAVKIVHFQDASVAGEKVQTRALTEAAICANVQHRNIVATYSYDLQPAGPNEELAVQVRPEGMAGAAAAGGAPAQRTASAHSAATSAASNATSWNLYLIQEFCEKGSLRQAVDAGCFHAGEKPNLQAVVQIALDIASGLHHLHNKNIIHGDLTPSNILLRPDGGRPCGMVAKLADFGLSAKVKDHHECVEDRRTGTPFYASPEVRQLGNLTKSSDIYAFGVLLWELYWGRPCYQRVRGHRNFVQAQGFPSFPPACPSMYSLVAENCLKMDYRQRPQVTDILQSLQFLVQALEGATVTETNSMSMSGRTSMDEAASSINTVPPSTNLLARALLPKVDEHPLHHHQGQGQGQDSQKADSRHGSGGDGSGSVTVRPVADQSSSKTAASSLAAAIAPGATASAGGAAAGCGSSAADGPCASGFTASGTESVSGVTASHVDGGLKGSGSGAGQRMFRTLLPFFKQSSSKQQKYLSEASISTSVGGLELSDVGPGTGTATATTATVTAQSLKSPPLSPPVAQRFQQQQQVLHKGEERQGTGPVFVAERPSSGPDMMDVEANSAEAARATHPETVFLTADDLRTTSHPHPHSSSWQPLSHPHSHMNTHTHAHEHQA